MKNLIIFSCAILLFFSGCRKDSLDTKSVINYPGPSVLIQASIGGVVLDENGNAVIDATVRTGANIVKTDQNGVFLFKNITTDAAGSYISVEHAGYFHGSRTVIALPGSRNKVKIQLLSNTPTKFISGNDGGRADYDDYSVTLPATGVVTSSGVTYTGQIGVAARWLNPTAANFGIQVPGQLKGVKTDGTTSGMISKGMLAVELTDNAGNKLQIKDGFEATLRMKVDNVLLNDAPETIPLWYFDEQQGMWKEEGSANLQNGVYEGQVKHFTWWAWGYTINLIPVQLKIINQNSAPLPNTSVTLSASNNGGLGIGITDNNGIVAAEVPENMTFTAAIFLSSLGCTTPSLVQEVGPFSPNDMHTFTIDVPTNVNYQITGDLLDCSGQPLSEGYVYISELHDGFFTDNQGHIDFSFITCEPITTITVTGYNLPLQLTSQEVVMNASAGNNNFGSLAVCSAIDSYLTYSFDSNNLLYIPDIYFSHGPSFDSIQIKAYPVNLSGGYANIILTEPVNGPGTYTGAGTYVDYVNSQPFYHAGGISVIVTEYNGLGGYIVGTYSGDITTYNPDGQVSVTGTFKGKLH